jgi:segregation and condensation protein A
MEKQRSRRAMICLFLAVLEMVKAHSVQILQKDLFGEIALGKGECFDDEPSPAAQVPAAQIDEEYK